MGSGSRKKGFIELFHFFRPGDADADAERAGDVTHRDEGSNPDPRCQPEDGA